MAEPTFVGTVGLSRTAFIRGSGQSTGEIDYTTYSYQNFIEIGDKSGNSIHIIMGTGAPSTTYDSAPGGSKYVNLTCGMWYTFLINDSGTKVWAADTVAISSTVDDSTAFTALPSGGIMIIDTDDSSVEIKSGVEAADADISLT